MNRQLLSQRRTWLVIASLLVVGIRWWSYHASYRRVLGGFSPFVMPLVLRFVKHSPATSISAANKQRHHFFPEEYVPANQGGLIRLEHVSLGTEWEIEERHLFWIIRIGDSSILDNRYELEVSAPGYQPQRIPWETLIAQENGTETVTKYERQYELPLYTRVVTLTK